MMEPLFKTIMGLSISASLMIAIVMLLRMCLKRKQASIKQSAFVIAWVLILLRLCLPFSLDFPLYEDRATPAQAVYSTMFNESVPQDGRTVRTAELRSPTDLPGIGQPPQISVPGIDASKQNTGLPAETETRNLAGPSVGSAQEHAVNESANSSAASAVGADILLIAALIWAVIAGAMLTGTAISYIKTLRSVKHQANARIRAPELYNEAMYVKRKLGLKRKIQIVVGHEGKTAVYGIFRPIVLIDVNSFDRMEYLLTHEFVHIKRNDNLRKLLARVCLCLHWFNPFVWGAVRALENDIENACDEKVLASMGYQHRKNYAETILKLAEKQQTPRIAAFAHFGKHPVTSRIKHVLYMSEKSKATPVLACVVFLFILAGCFSNPVIALAKQMNHFIGRYQIEDGIMGVERPYMETHDLVDYLISEDSIYFALSDRTGELGDRLVVKDNSDEVIYEQIISDEDKRIASTIVKDDHNLYYFLRNQESLYQLIQWNFETDQQQVLYSNYFHNVTPSEKIVICEEGDFLTWFEDDMLVIFNKKSNEVIDWYQTNGHQDFASIMDGYTVYQWTDPDSGETIISRIPLKATTGPISIKSLLGNNTYSVYANEEYIVYKEAFQKGADIVVYCVAEDKSISLWDLLADHISEKELERYRKGTWGINLMKDKLVLTGEGNSVCYVDLGTKTLEEVANTFNGTGFYQPKNSSGSFSVIQYGSTANQVHETGKIYTAQVVENMKK